MRGAAGALDLLLSALTGFVATSAGELTRHVQRFEDALLDDGRTPDQRALIAARRRAVQLHRQLDGLRNVVTRLEQDEELPEAVRPVVERLAQRVVGLDGEVTAIERQTRSLREELDLQAMQRTNQNLFILSVLTALMLPSTLVTGIFGMNTGGLPFAQSAYGTLAATLLAVAAAFGVFLLLRLMGFFGGRR